MKKNDSQRVLILVYVFDLLLQSRTVMLLLLSFLFFAMMIINGVRCVLLGLDLVCGCE